MTLMDWSPRTVRMVRAVKDFFGLFSGTSVAGIPLDWPLRFLVLGALHGLLRRKLTLRTAAAIGTGLLLATEVLEIFATRRPHALYWPDMGDAADVISGLAGIGVAELLLRSRRK